MGGGVANVPAVRRLGWGQLGAQVSHFVLRLAHCRGEELRKWFLAQEGDLFAARFREEPGKVRCRTRTPGPCFYMHLIAFGVLVLWTRRGCMQPVKT